MNKIIERIFNKIHKIKFFKKEDGSLWFFAGSVCKVLDLDNVSAATRSLDKEEKDRFTEQVPHRTDPTMGMNTVTYVIISESGLYRLIFKSRKPAAVVFRKWVTSVLLPEIRREGSYNKNKTPAVLLRQAEATFRASIRLAKLVGFEKEEQIAGAVAATARLTGFNLLELLSPLPVPTPEVAEEPVPEPVDGPADKPAAVPVTDINDWSKEALSVAQVGEKLATGNAKKTNEVIERHGYQEAVRDNRSRIVDWAPTEKGKQFCCYKSFVRSDGTEGQRLLWRYTLVSHLRPLIRDIAGRRK